MKNTQGNKENLNLYNKEGVVVYEFYTYSDGSGSYENTYDKKGRALTSKYSTGYRCKYTRDEKGNELTYEDSYGAKRGFDTPEFTMAQLVKEIRKF